MAECILYQKLINKVKEINKIEWEDNDENNNNLLELNNNENLEDEN